MLLAHDPPYDGREHHISLFYRFELPETQYRIEAPGLTMYDPVIVDMQGRLTFGTERAWHRWFSAVRTMSILLPVIYVLWQLRRLLKTLRGGRPFDRENARRVRNIGLAVLLGNTLVQGWYYLASTLALKHIQQQGITMAPRIDWELFVPVTFLGLVILVVAEFFRQGTVMAEEQSLTI